MLHSRFNFTLTSLFNATRTSQFINGVMKKGSILKNSAYLRKHSMGTAFIEIEGGVSFVKYT